VFKRKGVKVSVLILGVLLAFNLEGENRLNLASPPIVPTDTFRIYDSIPASPGGIVTVPVHLKNTLAVVGYGLNIMFNPSLSIDTAFPGEAVDSFWTGITFGYDILDSTIYIIALTGGNPFTNYFPPGDHIIAYINFRVPPTIPVGTVLPIIFFDDSLHSPPRYNVITDTTDFADKMPIKDNGSLYVTILTTPPQIEPIPDTSVYEGGTLNLQVTASDPDGDSLSLWAENLPPNASFPMVSGDSLVSGVFTFSPDTTQGPNVYPILFVAQDENGARDSELVFIEVIEVVNLPPVFTPIQDTSVKEGDTLEIIVMATDPEGSPVVLTTGPLPPNASFIDYGNNTGLFLFTPDFNQGPDTVTVTFYATDSLGAVGSEDVIIEIIDVPYDVLSGGTNGGLPGSSNIPIPITIRAQDTIYGVQFDLAWNPEILSVDTVIRRPEYPDYIVYFNEMSRGTLRVIFMSYNLSPIPEGDQILLDVFFSVSNTALSGEYGLSLFNAMEVIDIYGNWRELVTEDGLFIVDILGDVNLDGVVNIGDIVLLVSYLLGLANLTPRQLSNADANQDNTVNVGDVVAIINIILGRQIPVSPIYEPGLAFISLEDEGGVMAFTSTCNSPIGGVEVELNFNPAEVELLPPEKSENLTQFTLSHRITDDGKMIILLYSLSGDSIPPGDFTLFDIGYVGNMESIKIKRIFVSDPYGRLLSVFIGGKQVPRSNVLALYPNVPNPFREKTRIGFSIPEGQFVRLYIYNISGQRLRTIFEGNLKAGFHTVIWDGKDDTGRRVSPGVYFVTLNTLEKILTRKMMFSQ